MHGSFFYFKCTFADEIEILMPNADGLISWWIFEIEGILGAEIGGYQHKMPRHLTSGIIGLITGTVNKPTRGPKASSSNKRL